MSSIQPRIVLSLLAGHSSLLTRELVWGVPVAPFAVGARGDWAIDAPEVSERHLFLTFDGYRLLAAAASPAHDVSIDGVRVGTDWTQVAVPSRLSFGAASVSITCKDVARSVDAPVRPSPIIDLSRPDRQPTQIVDLSHTLQLRTVRLEISESLLAELREAPAPEPVPDGAAPTATSAQSGDTLIFQVGPLRTPTLSLPPAVPQAAPAIDLANTLYDGGALRERAAQLASEHERADAAEPVPLPPMNVNLLDRPLLAFRRSSLPKRLTICLFPLAVASVWAMRDEAASASSVPAASAHEEPRSAALGTTLAHTASASPQTPLESSELAAIEASGQPSDLNERSALIAAFSGNKTLAAALYERLAKARNSPTLSLAARFVREDRVRKP